MIAGEEYYLGELLLATKSHENAYKYRGGREGGEGVMWILTQKKKT